MEIPIDELQHEAEDLLTTRQPAGTQAPSAQQDTESELDISDRQDHHQQRRNRRLRRQAQGFYEETPLDESHYTATQPPTTGRPAVARTAIARQDSDSENRTGEYYDPYRRP